MGRGERIIIGKALIKKTLKDHKQKTFDATFCRLPDVSPQNMSHHPFTISEGPKRGRFKNLMGLNTGGFSHLLPAVTPFPIISFRPRFSFRAAESLTLPTTEKKKEGNKKTASYALAELYKPFNSLSFFVAPDENSDRKQQNSGGDTN